ncbi:MAG: bifunctional 3,4-dihydroxy-2-butanone-4-phosphate synthase/GTP cyclohydrolase II [Aliifodinibius sp.]|nr:bifunctional 3,4-dihydroxy-2-butanone-4-phosphate synthase/GTP cyclohydrolase II [candidate division KSB1 bacterium]NIT57880.1 bifunctional 3,4-dihydroxy-2-butanone-4-phosphate synthase/GTP cyclohydrolase II [Fodinibius sp.]NIV12744.1 bifunctional 3,4-dihydroxy-2-butanone-4-phosphate synthase/GTP cyclohydrolase II [Fodinibius sp.]NIY26462.1 bifunctional 3,4-dihydroxy-2-butanone-4-phosphate synthase/GTP cyclohydrolase II [Fodinibius sp.]
MGADINFDSIEDAIEDIKEGRMVIVADDEDRENEGDFVMAAEKVTPEAINLMAKYGRGLICVPITREKAYSLNLDYMVTEGADPDEAAFTVSVDHKELTTTGISAGDRANTIKEMIKKDAKPGDFRRPGHIFPLIGTEGGVLRRAGHTEAAIDLARLADLQPAGIICEIMKDNGAMARLPDLVEIADEFNMKLISIKDLISYRMQNESLVRKVVDVNLPTIYGDFQLHAFQERLTGDHHLALAKGEWNEDDPVLVRVHSSCMTGDIFGSKRCDCGEQLHQALLQVEEEGRGVVLYMNQEGRGIGLVNKLKAYKLQEEGLDTVEANEALGFEPDARDYGVGAQILRNLGISKMRLMTNNPVKRVGLKSFGLEMTERVPLEVGAYPENVKYLKTKRDKMGHDLKLDELDPHSPNFIDSIVTEE